MRRKPSEPNDKSSNNARRTGNDYVTVKHQGYQEVTTGATKDADHDAHHGSYHTIGDKDNINEDALPELPTQPASQPLNASTPPFPPVRSQSRK